MSALQRKNGSRKTVTNPVLSSLPIHATIIQMKQRVVFFGSGDYSIPVIQMLQNHGLVYVLTTEVGSPLISFLQKENIPYASTKVTGEKKIARDELWKSVEELEPTLGVLASFGAIIPQRIIDLFPEGIWNIHPSLLPKYKGPSPIQGTLLAGDEETGVTIITLDDQVDHGPILAQERVQLDGTETTEQLKHDLFAKGAAMIETLLTTKEQGEELISTPQNHKNETWTEKITKEHGKIDAENPPEPVQLDRMIRAYHPWPGVWFQWKMENGKSRIVKLLPSNKIQVEGKNIMTFKDFINGYQEEGKKILNKLHQIF